MGDKTRNLIALLIGIFIGVACVLWIQQINKEAERIQRENKEKEIIDTIHVIWRQSHFVLSDSTLLAELNAQEIKFSNIVLAQAILETGHFKSYSCTEHNNLFGLRNKDGSYMYFNHWTDCVAAYKRYVQKWTQPPHDYYTYLDSLGYAEDKSYTKVLKQIVK